MEDVPRFDGNGTVKEPKRDATLQHPRCVINVLRRHFARYTPRDGRRRVRHAGPLRRKDRRTWPTTARANARPPSPTPSAGRSTPSACRYIRTAAILQIAARQHGPSGRRNHGAARTRQHPRRDRHPDALRLLPGYLPMPSALRDEQTSPAYSRTRPSRPAGGRTRRKYIVSLLKAYYGDAATAENDFCFEYLPQIAGDYSRCRRRSR